MPHASMTLTFYIPYDYYTEYVNSSSTNDSYRILQHITWWTARTKSCRACAINFGLQTICDCVQLQYTGASTSWLWSYMPLLMSVTLSMQTTDSLVRFGSQAFFFGWNLEWYTISCRLGDKSIFHDCWACTDVHIHTSLLLRNQVGRIIAVACTKRPTCEAPLIGAVWMAHVWYT